MPWYNCNGIAAAAAAAAQSHTSHTLTATNTCIAAILDVGNHSVLQFIKSTKQPNDPLGYCWEKNTAFWYN